MGFCLSSMLSGQNVDSFENYGKPGFVLVDSCHDMLENG